MENVTANLWLKKALAILTTSNKPMSAKELHEKAGNEISLPHAILAMKHAAEDNLVEAHKQGNKKATLFTLKGKSCSAGIKKQTAKIDSSDACQQLIGEIHTILQKWLADIAEVDAQLVEILLKIKRK